MGEQYALTGSCGLGWVSNTRSRGARPATENPYLGTTVGGTTPGLSYTRSTARAAVHATGRPSYCRVVEQHPLTGSCGLGWVTNACSRGAVLLVICCTNRTQSARVNAVMHAKRWLWVNSAKNPLCILYARRAAVRPAPTVRLGVGPRTCRHSAFCVPLPVLHFYLHCAYFTLIRSFLHFLFSGHSGVQAHWAFGTSGIGAPRAFGHFGRSGASDTRVQ